MIIVGGTYREICDWPEWDRIMGPGARAALAVSAVSPCSELYTYVHDESRLDLETTMSAYNVKLHAKPRPSDISFHYKHPLSLPNKELAEVGFVQNEPWAITGDTVLAFQMLESEVCISAERAVFELSANDQKINRGRIKKLALIASPNDFPDMPASGPDIPDYASQILMAFGADLLIVRLQSGGGWLFDGEIEHKIPAYEADEWFKIGAGNVFCAMFAYYWGEMKIDPVLAADLASKNSAYYASARALPMTEATEIPEMKTFDPESKCKVFIASPCKSMAQQWLLDEALWSFSHLGVETVSPYELGLDQTISEKIDITAALDGCKAVLALAEGADMASVFAVGLAHVRKLPIVVLAEKSSDRQLGLWDGTECEIAQDFSSAVYRAMVAGRRNCDQAT